MTALSQSRHLGADRRRACWCWPSIATATPRRALARAGRRGGGLRGDAAAVYRLRARHSGDAVRRDASSGFRASTSTTSSASTASRAVHPAQQLHHAARRLAGWEVIEKRVAQYMAAFLIMSGLINGVFAALDGDAVLRVLRGDADPDVPDHRRLGRPEPRLRGGQVLPLHAAGLAADAGRADLPVQRSAAASRSSSGTSCRLSLQDAGTAVRRLLLSPSRSRCRCGRCTPGCPTRTSRRRPAARWSWRRSR